MAQKQSYKGVLIQRCSGNMQQIYKRTQLLVKPGLGRWILPLKNLEPEKLGP